MEWNGKSLGQWDWEHLFFFNAKATENPKFQPTDNCSGEVDREINVGMLYPSGGSACFGSELIHASSSRSSKSASNNSSSNGDSKASILTLEGSQDDSTGKKDLCNGEPVETSPTAVPSPVSGEPLLTLKLGKRLYFEDVCTGNDAKKPSCKVPVSSGKKYKTTNQNLQHPICQVEGCGLDLSPAKDYHRKHRVCETHSKSPKVVVAGLERRFCQQCSRFHSLSEFDDKKRSCRRRLSDHNARRRKPQPNTIQLNPSALSSPYGITAGRQTMNPFAFSRNATNLAWQDMHNSKFPHTKDLLPKPTKAFNKIPNIVSMLSNDSSGLLTSRGIATKSIVPGLADPITSCDPNTTTTQDVNRALSLLSTSPWGAYETKSLSLDHSTRTSDITQSVTHAINQRLPPHLSDYWHTDQPQQPPPSTMCISFSDCDSSNRFQDFQLLSAAPYESGFPCNPLD